MFAGLIKRTKVDRSRPLNIVVFNVHEAYQTVLSKTGHNFFVWEQDGLKEWDEKYRPRPSNFYSMDRKKGVAQIPEWAKIDLVISENKMAHYNIAASISQRYGCPLICLEHCLPPPNWGPENIAYFKNMGGNENVFITDFNREAWNWSEHEASVIYHAVDHDNFCPGNVERQNKILVVANDYINRDWCLNYKMFEWLNKQGLPFTVLGNTPGLSEAAKNTEELIKAYQTHSIFLNTSVISPVPMSLLEAASCGCAIVTTSGCSVREFFSHCTDALFGDNWVVARGWLEALLNNPDVARTFGDNARKTILAKCGMSRFVSQWNSLFYGCLEKA